MQLNSQKVKNLKFWELLGRKTDMQENADISILVPTVDKKLVTPHTEFKPLYGIV